MTPPLTTPSTELGRHPRGVIEVDRTCPGERTFRIYDCRGLKLEERTVPFVLCDSQTRASLKWTLEHYCPSDPAKHAVTCPGDCGHRQPELRLLA